jgi:acid phosphatase family membrane protein YuiD
MMEVRLAKGKGVNMRSFTSLVCASVFALVVACDSAGVASLVGQYASIKNGDAELRVSLKAITIWCR